MSAWTPKYTENQRRAVEHAYCDVRIRPVTKIVRMAAAGELRSEHDGELLAPFEIPYSSAATIAKAAERRRAGKNVPPDLANQPARDRAHSLQLRLTALIHRDLERMENAQRRRPNSAVDAEHARKLARALRELATLPDPSEKRLPRTPGQAGPDGEQPDGATRDSLAGKLLAASDQSMSPSVRAEIPGTATDERINVSEPESDREPATHGRDDGGEREIADEHDDEANGERDEDGPCQAPRERISSSSASGLLEPSSA